MTSAFVPSAGSSSASRSPFRPAILDRVPIEQRLPHGLEGVRVAAAIEHPNDIEHVHARPNLRGVWAKGSRDRRQVIVFPGDEYDAVESRNRLHDLRFVAHEKAHIDIDRNGARQRRDGLLGTPDGQRILYASGDDLYIARDNGATVSCGRKLFPISSSSGEGGAPP